MKKSLKQALATLVLPALVAGVVCPSHAWAVDAAEVVSAEPSAPVQVVQDDEGSALSNEELLAGYIEQQFAAQLPAQDDGEPELSAQSVGESLTGNTAIAYEYVKAEVAKIAAGERTSTKIDIPLTLLTDKTSWTAADLGVDAIIVGGKLNAEACDALNQQLAIDFGKLNSALLCDLPYELYWYNKTGNGGGIEYSSGLAMTGNSSGLRPTSSHYIAFSVADDYAASKYVVNTPVAGRVNAAISEAARIVSDNEGKSSYEKLVAYKEAICGLVSYNSAAAAGGVPYGDPWQLVYVFDGDTSTNVVCEGYSKAFKYLCDLSSLHGIECLLVSGTMGGGTGAGPHMWNIVKMYDGKNYLVDVTNCDERTIGEPNKLFFKGFSSGTVSGGYYFINNQIGYVYDDDMTSLYGNDALTLASTDFDPAAVVEPTVEDLSAASVVAGDMTYTGSALTPEPTVTLGTKTLVAGTDYTVAYENNVNAGTAIIIVTGTGDYEGTATGTFTINPKPVTPTIVLSTTAATYTGHELRPPVSRVTADGIQLSSKYYDVTYPENCINAGTYQVSVTLKGNYTGTGTATFTIRQAAMSSTTVELEQGPFVYNGAAHRPAFTVNHAGEVVSASNYTVTYGNNVNAGMATIRLVGKGNFNGPKNVTFTIEPRVLEDEMVALGETSFTYDGSAKKPEVTVEADGTALVAGTDYTVAYTDNTDAGAARVVVTGAGNYTGEAEQSFTIARAAQQLSAQDVTVGVGGTATLAVQVLGDAPLTYEAEDTSVAAVSADGVVTGVKSGSTRVNIEAAATKNYEAGSASVEVTVATRSLDDAQVMLAQEHFVYDGTAHEPEAMVELDGAPLVMGTDYTVAYEDNTDAGTATATITGKGVYAGTRVVSFEIERAEKGIVIVNSEVLGLAYGEAATLDVEAEGATAFASSNASVVTVDTAGTLVARGLGQAELTITAAGTKNYLPAELHATVHVVAAHLADADVSLASESFTYTGEAHEPVVTVTLRGRELACDSDYTVTYEGNIDAGTASVVVAGLGNYAGTVRATFDIEPMDLASEGIGSSIAGQTYTGDPLTPLPTLTFGGKTLAEGEDYSLGGYEDNVEEGTGRLTVIGEGNFTGAITLTFEISAVHKTDISAAVVEVASQEFQDAELVPEVTVLLDGELLPSDAYSISYGYCVHAGDYTVTVKGEGDYTGMATGTFTITRRPAEVTVSLQKNTFVYDGSAHKPGSASQPLVSVRRDKKYALGTGSYELSYSGDCVDAGTYTVTATLLGDYEGTGTAEFTITPAEQELTVEPNTLALDKGEEASLVAQAMGDISYESSDASVATVSPEGRVVAVGEGTATITVTATAIKNYQAASVEIPVTVSAPAVGPDPDDPTPGPDDPTPIDLSGAQVTLAREEFVYDGTAREPEITVVLDGATLTVGTDYTVAYADNTDAGTATVTIAGTGAYTGETTATFAIAKAKPVITAADKKVVATKTVELGATATEGAGTLTYKSLNTKVATVSDTGVVKGVSAGTAKVTVSCAGDANHEAASKTVTITVSRASSTLKVSTKKKSVTASLKKVARKNLTLAPNLTVSVAKGQQVTYASASTKAVAKKFKINAKNGKITVVKGTKKGTYTVKVKVTAKQSAVYKAATKTVSYKVVVK